ncbi:MAG: methylcobamide--CoM methyltransferase [candidate division KSB1 bacterium]|nr:methylcobamide--CoM methyltransferase [candidate division KSB1 bacterium]MDZ7318039.1 methylcobamide--CoM methyltransferase [candidate division KSB1 bacterium]MDZ7341319.1 methylcobamide--CoM methyltransferase [candidate division KSB1 bacterium]
MEIIVFHKRSWSPLPREEVIKAIERKYPMRVPLVLAKWWGEGLREQYGDRLQEFDRFPEDVGWLWLQPLDVNTMGLSWSLPSYRAYDSQVIIDDWAKLDEFIEKMPDPDNDSQFDALHVQAEKHRAENRYVLFAWWRLFFERPWGLRGMENLLIDYYEAPDKVRRLHDALCNLYIGYLERAVRELRPDGFFTSDDLGHQTQSMMSPQLFDEFIKPYYMRLGQVLQRHYLHWWLHSCGNNTPLLPALVQAGVSVFHPVQKHTMDEIAVAQEYGDRLAFLAGFDVQQTLVVGHPDEIRAEVRFLIDTFDRPDGGLCLAAGNGIVSGTPFENIEAFLDEAMQYGMKHRAQFSG